ncbi:MAG TPA: TIGR03435 family protein [Candidatus Limnocylindrales bacterium]|nr:TIGR03435 family protein [Candidatus Limnocylindrales bacterium]
MKLLVAALLTAGAVLAQTAGVKPKGFELADVHPSRPGATESDGGFMPGGRLELRGSTLLNLITFAYDVEDGSVLGGPPWLNSNRYDIIAKAPNATDFEGLRSMLQALLADRFKLVLRQEKRDLPVYILTVAKKPPKLQAAADPSAPPRTARADGDPAVNQHVKCTSFTMQRLAEYLAEGARNYVNHPVIDETGLTGAYDFQLDWMGINVYRQAKANPDGPRAVSAFDAVDKLGLHLEEGKRPLPVIVVESASATPTPNAEGVVSKLPAFPTEFEVSEVRPAKPFTPPGRGGSPGVLGAIGAVSIQNGRVEILSATLKGLVSIAFAVEDRNLFGGPAWADKDRFDVIAKTAPGVPWDSIQKMLQAVLLQEFKLKIHTEDRDLPVSVLKAGKKPLLQPSGGSARSDCKIENTDRRYFVCQNTTMAQFAERLPPVSAAYVHAPILDLTGLKGAYDFKVFWTPKNFLQRAAPRTGEAVSDASSPVEEFTLAEALDKQLGLKLEEEKHPIAVTVIDTAVKVQ